jgi:hypothetical protein
VGPRVGLDYVLTLPGLEFRPLVRPARSRLLCRLLYPGFGVLLSGSIDNKNAEFLTLLPLYIDGNSPQHRRLDWSESRSELYGKKKIS